MKSVRIIFVYQNVYGSIICNAFVRHCTGKGRIKVAATLPVFYASCTRDSKFVVTLYGDYTSSCCIVTGRDVRNTRTLSFSF